MSFPKWPFKDPDEVLDYDITWTAKLIDSDTIDTSTWLVPDGITHETDSETNGVTTVWLSGGTTGSTYEITNRITTSAGRTWDQTMKLPVKDR